MKPCPFCKGQARPYICTDAGMWFVQCQQCQVKTKLFGSRSEAEAFWGVGKKPKQVPKKPEPVKPTKKNAKKPIGNITNVSLSNRKDIEQSALERLKGRHVFGVFGTVACQLER